MNAIVTLIVQAVLGLCAGAAWFYLVYIGKVPADGFISTLQLGLGALIAHLLHQNIMTNNALGVIAQTQPMPGATGTSGPLVDKGGQAGFAQIKFLILMAVATCLLAGCATAYRAGFESSLTSAKAVDDNLVLTEKTAMCALPLSAILRNADIIPGIKALCLPGGNASDPNGILPDPQHAPVQVQIVPNNPQGK